ncbi:lytic transglycosylase domain-containing protein [Roseomonas sp. JC162]|uniref:Lytic transglycosylase domain-containing protein n=1 Tax=Neoroseomonas marina TaxID=1232220 RepID=A0A848EA04_9PROT|nr:lytic transglycosylase domain-containing protein [Neoroseomonas marina]NMJ40075.1 lytic transglycosylase domain-containing protein [Neoroseomonas marina]
MLPVPRPSLRLLGLLLPVLAATPVPAEANAPQRTEAAAQARTAPAARGRAQTASATAPAARPPSDDPWDACARAISAAEAGSGLPPGLLGAIARVETGRRTPTGGVQPWPWSFNAAGEGRYMGSRAEAVAEVQSRLAAGTRSIDIGCMQINLLHHPDAFPSVDAGFEPTTNVAYAVRYLKSLYAQTGDWAQATARYHSATPERGLIYHQRVMAAMSGQGFVPGPAPGVIPLPGPAMAGLCASGRGAVLLIGAQAPSLRPVVAVPNVELRLQGRAQQPARPRIMCLRTTSRSAPG